MENKSFVTKESTNDRCLQLVISNKQPSPTRNKGKVAEFDPDSTTQTNIYREMSAVFRVIKSVSDESARQNLITAWQKETKLLFW